MNEFKLDWMQHAAVEIPQQYHKVKQKAVAFDKKAMQTIDTLGEAGMIAAMDSWLPFADVIAIGYAAVNIFDIWKK